MIYWIRLGLAVGIASLAACGGTDASIDTGVAAAGLAPEESSPAAVSEGELARQSGSDVAPLRVQAVGDLADMVERRTVRVLVSYSKTFYFLDGPTQRGVSYEAANLFVEWLNARHDVEGRPIRAVFLPTPPDELLSSLAAGEGDIAAAGLTITAARSASVDFAAPFAENVIEVLVTGPAAPEVRTLRDLAGKSVWVRPSSSYAESLASLSADLESRGLAPIVIEAANEVLADEDLLEMVDAGLLPMVVVDSYKAQLWNSVFENITFREDLPIASGREIAWAIRKDTPELAAAVGEFTRTHRQGTLTGNILINRYFRDNEWIGNNLGDASQQRLAPLIAIFENYAARFDFNWMLLAAQGYQESGLDQSARSRAGAVGIMQLLPSTAADPNVGVANIEIAENNIHAGAKYLRFLLDRYFADGEMSRLDRHLFAFAAYNAGPARIRRLRTQAAESGFDPDVWFGQVEVIAAREVGREPVVYVRNIFQYYLAYRLIEEQLRRREAALAR
jgi:membrane-bound lytic murein transglycosylase MltF